MKRTNRIIAILCILATVFSLFAFPASAANVCGDSISGKSDPKGGNKTVFYVTAKDTKSHYVQMKQTKKGTLTKTGSKNLYGFYEIRIWGKNSAGKYVELTNLKFNIKNESKTKITFKGYKKYKIQVYSWKTPTIGTWVAQHGSNLDVLKFPLPTIENTYWSVRPEWTISKTSGITFCSE